jgi:hypothetical protein
VRAARLATLALAATVLMPVAAPPASADSVGFIEFSGTAYIDCFGCGISNGTADLTVRGVVGGGVVVSGAEYAKYTVNEPSLSPQCMVTGTASGTADGAVSVTFNWTRVGANAVVTVTGDVTGAGPATFVVTSPAFGVACGGPVTAHVEGFVF